MNATEFLAALYSDVPDGSALVIWRLQDKRSVWCDTTDQAAHIAVQASVLYDTYFGIGLQNKAGASHESRGSAATVTHLPGVWAEVDVADAVHKKPNLPPDDDAALALLASLPLQPSIVLHSGHGLQAYWLFRELWELETDGERARAASLVERWQGRLREAASRQGWDVDATHDLARVFRVAGTTNHKDRADTRPVRVVAVSEQRYDPSDIEEHLPAARTRPASAGVQDDSPPPAMDAALPFERWDALMANDPKFKRTWERKRTDFQDQSASTYSLSIASITMAAGWNDDEIAAAIRSWRTKQGEDPRTDRPDWYARTIAKARSERGQDTAFTEMAAGEGTDPGATPDEERAAILDQFSRAIGVHVTGWLQHGRERTRFSLRLGDGREISIGTSTVVLSLDQFRARLTDAGVPPIPTMKKDRWLAVVQQLWKATEIIENTDATREQTVLSWVRGYLRDGDLQAKEDNWQQALSEDQPFVKKGMVYLHAEELRRYVILRAMERIEAPDLHDMLRTAGFTHKKVSGRYNSRVHSRSYWWAPRSVLEESSAEPSAVEAGV